MKTQQPRSGQDQVQASSVQIPKSLSLFPLVPTISRPPQLRLTPFWSVSLYLLLPSLSCSVLRPLSSRGFRTLLRQDQTPHPDGPSLPGHLNIRTYFPQRLFRQNHLDADKTSRGNIGTGIRVKEKFSPRLHALEKGCQSRKLYQNRHRVSDWSLCHLFHVGPPPRSRSHPF